MERYRQTMRFTAETLRKPVNALAFSADGRLLAVCCMLILGMSLATHLIAVSVADDYSVHIIAVEAKGRVYKRVATRGGPMAAAQWATDARGGYWLFTAGLQGMIRIFSVKLLENTVCYALSCISGLSYR